MGWFQTEGTAYSRYVIFQDQPDLVYEVDMEGEVLGLSKEPLFSGSSNDVEAK